MPKDKEIEIFKNRFGTITSKRVSYYRKKGWFSSGIKEDIPIKHITSVIFEIKRHVIWGTILTLFGLIIFTPAGNGWGGFMFFQIIALIYGIIFLWGVPFVTVNTSGVDRTTSKGYPWQAKEAESFVKALNEQIFND